MIFPRRLGLGPVFAYEWLIRSRRWQAYALRGLFVLALLVGLGLVYQSATSNAALSTRQQLAAAGQSFFTTMVITQLSLILLAAPAATAGAICLDKARGTLTHVMVTDLSDAEVVLGKLGARLVPVLNLVACALPVAALGTLLGGIDPMALTGAFLVASGLAVLGCSMALAFSVWLSKAHEVMTAVYAIWSLWMLALPVWWLSMSLPAPFWLEISNPFWLTMAPYIAPMATSLIEPTGFLIVCLTISVGLAALSVRKVRPVYLHQMGRMPKPVVASRLGAWLRPQIRWWPGPSLDGNPVLWREWHRNRPSRITRVVWATYILLTSAFSLKVLWDLWSDPGRARNEGASILNGFQAVIGLLLLSASAGTLLSEERVRGSLDVLLSTPLSTRSIVWGKWWGAFRRVPWLAFWPGFLTLTCLKPGSSGELVTLAYLVPLLIIAQGAAIVSLGLALATWLPKAGRAVTWTVVALVGSTVGWPILGFLLGGNSGPSSLPQMLVIMGSPFWNVGMSTSLLEQNFGSQSELVKNVSIAATAWTLLYGSTALGLLLATLRSFDRCMGRTPENPLIARTPRREEARRIGQASGIDRWGEPRFDARPTDGLGSSVVPPR
ncbi:ABC transporter permease [Tundrisphaera lichenicola]|uniref:ABC transporter permease n=1 Tax=Tundrisphaera lichenicola TaxID=2029860 RepID=UPI003EB800A1